MLCTAKSDTFCSKFAGFLSVSRCICVCTNFHCSVFISPSHDSSEFSSDCSINCRDDSVIDISCRSVQRNCISFVVFFFYTFVILTQIQVMTPASVTATIHPHPRPPAPLSDSLLTRPTQAPPLATPQRPKKRHPASRRPPPRAFPHLQVPPLPGRHKKSGSPLKAATLRSNRRAISYP